MRVRSGERYAKIRTVLKGCELMNTPLPEILSLDQMKQRYHDEWLLIAYTDIDKNLVVLQGEVLAHAQNANDLYKLLPNYTDRPVAFEYIGEIPPDFAFML